MIFLRLCLRLSSPYSFASAKEKALSNENNTMANRITVGYLLSNPEWFGTQLMWCGRIAAGKKVALRYRSREHTSESVWARSGRPCTSDSMGYRVARMAEIPRLSRQPDKSGS